MFLLYYFRAAEGSAGPSSPVRRSLVSQALLLLPRLSTQQRTRKRMLALRTPALTQRVSLSTARTLSTAARRLPASSSSSSTFSARLQFNPAATAPLGARMSHGASGESTVRFLLPSLLLYEARERQEHASSRRGADPRVSTYIRSALTPMRFSLKLPTTCTTTRCVPSLCTARRR